MKKLLSAFASFFMLSCVTQPHIRQYNLSSGAAMYFLPASTWTGNDLQLDVDFNFKSDPQVETICNITIRQKGKLPHGLSSIVFNADSAAYPVTAIKILSVDSRSNAVRISSALSHDDFLKLMNSTNIFLHIIMNETTYKCLPTADFFSLQHEFQNNYFAIETILK
jgi:hypothetical protein